MVINRTFASLFVIVSLIIAIVAAVSSFADSTQDEAKVMVSDCEVVDRLLEVMENDIVPVTREAVEKGNKMFGAAILKKSDLSVVIVGTNNETQNPLWHGEVHAIKLLYELPASKRPPPEEILFLATHEPCPLCLSAITWAGYDNFYYFFSHEDSRDSFNIGHDLKILKEVFKHDPGGYARNNAYWKAYSIRDLAKTCDKDRQESFSNRIEKLKKTYVEMSDIYQQSKGETEIPLK